MRFLSLFLIASLSFAQHFETVWENNPFMPMTFTVYELNFNEGNMSPGDEIAVFDGDLCVGAVVLTADNLPALDNLLNIACSMVDEGGDGFAEGNTPSLRLWDANEAREISDADVEFVDNSGNALADAPPFAGLSQTFLSIFYTDLQGCTDPTAENYDQEASVDDGSCEYAPVLEPIDDATINEDESFALEFSASDQDGDDLFAMVEVSEPTVMVDEIAGEFLLTPAPNWHGSFEATVTVSDSVYQDSQSFTVTVLSVNDLPQFFGDNLPDAIEDENYSAILQVGDVDDEVLTVEISGRPDWLFVNDQADDALQLQLLDNEASLQFSGTPGDADTGEFVLVISLFDGEFNQVQNFDLLVVNVNDAPVAENQSLTVQEDMPTEIVLSAFDYESDGELEFSISTPPNHGDLTYNRQNATWSYDPDSNYFGSDYFEFTVAEPGGGLSDVGTVNITVEAVNDSPQITSQNLSYELPFNESVSIFVFMSDAGDGAMASELELIALELPAEGSVQGLEDGHFTFVANTDVVGPVQLVVAAQEQNSEEQLLSNTLTFTFDIIDDNLPPIAYADEHSCYEDHFLNFNLLAEDEELSIGQLEYEIGDSPAHAAEFSLTGFHIFYQPEDNFDGTDEFTFRVYDGTIWSEFALVTIEMIPVNDYPIAIGGELNAGGDSSFTFDFADFIDDIETPDEELTIVTVFEQDGCDGGSVQSGCLNQIGDTIWQYDMADNIFSSDIIPFRVEDPEGDSSPTRVLFVQNLDGMRQAPRGIIVVNSNYWMNGNTSKQVEFLAFDFDTFTQCELTIDEEALQFGAFTEWETPYFEAGSGMTSIIAHYEANNVDGLESIPFTMSNFSGTTDGEINIGITAQILPPIIGHIPDVDMEEDSFLTQIIQYENGTSPETMQWSAISIPDVQFNFQFAVGSQENEVELHITPRDNYFGEANIIVEVEDSEGHVVDAGFYIHVANVNDAPVLAEIEEFTLMEDETQILELSADDVDGDQISYSVTSDDESVLTVQVDENLLTVQTVPNANSEGVSIHVFAEDSEGLVDEAVLTVPVLPVNDPPILSGLSNILQIDEDLLSSFEFNTIDVDGEDVTVNVIVENENLLPLENVQIEPLTAGNGVPRTISLLGSTNSFGSTQLTISMNDGNTQEVQHFTLEILSVNDAPTIDVPVELTMDEDSNSILPLNPSDVDGDEFEYSVSTDNANLVFYFEDDVLTINSENDYFGESSLQLTVTDADGASSSETINLQVLPVNDAPTITGQSNQNTAEGSQFTLMPQFLTVTDVDNFWPQGFSLYILEGTNYSILTGSTIQVDEDFSGMITIPVYVNDGESDSPLYDFQLSVTEEPDWPVIIGQNPVTINEEQGILLNLDILLVDDPDNIFPNDFSMQVQPGENYTLYGVYLQPVSNFFGTLLVPVTVNDGQYFSDVYELEIEVLNVNDPPMIDGQIPLQLAEDESLHITLDMITVVDVDNELEDISLHVLAGQNYTNVGVEIFPNPNYYGELTIRIRVYDGALYSGIFNLAITITNVNDAPMVSGQVPVEMDEDSELQIHLGMLEIADVDSELEDMQLAILFGENYTVLQENTIEPIADFNGDLFVNLQVNDGELDSEVFALLTSVINVNDAPIITGQEYRSVEEDHAILLSIDDVTAIDVDGEVDALTFTVLDGTNYSHASNVVLPALNYFGNLLLNVQVSDGSSDSELFHFELQVEAVNDAPIITGQQEITKIEDQSFNIQLSDLQVLDFDNDVEDINLTINAGENYSYDEGQIIPAENFVGPLVVPVFVSDGTDVSTVFQVEIEVQNVNDAPGAFSLLSPENGFFVSDSIEQRFEWEASIDIDSDSLSYGIFLESGDYSRYILCDDTESKVNLWEPDVPLDAPIQWSVFVNDGEIQVWSSETWTFSISNILHTSSAIPNALSLGQNHPNPFNPETRIPFALPNSGHVEMHIFDLQGRQVVTLLDTHKPAGLHEAKWDGRNEAGAELPGGMYFLRLRFDGQQQYKTITLLK